MNTPTFTRIKYLNTTLLSCFTQLMISPVFIGSVPTAAAMHTNKSPSAPSLLTVMSLLCPEKGKDRGGCGQKDEGWGGGGCRVREEDGGEWFDFRVCAFCSVW